MQEWDFGTCLLITMALVVMVVLVVAKVLEFICEFTGELRYLNNEIRRTMGEERQHWVYRRRRLWLSLIPFVRY